MATRWGETFRVTTDGVQMHNIISYSKVQYNLLRVEKGISATRKFRFYLNFNYIDMWNIKKYDKSDV